MTVTGMATRFAMACLLVAAACSSWSGGSDVSGDVPVDPVQETSAGDKTEQDMNELTIMTFNVLCSFCDPAYDPWVDRLGYQADLIARHGPDILGLQEFVFAEEVDEYLALNPGYAAVFFQTDDPEAPLPAYPDETILYRKDRFVVVESGFFWLSPTPDVPYSLGFIDAGQLWRLVGWVLLEQKANGRRFYFANTHFDPNHPNQEISGPLVYERFDDKVAQHPFIFTGDFNTHPGDEGYANLVEGVPGHDWTFTNTFDIAEEWEIVTNLDPVPAYDVDDRIDHILTAGGAFSCSRWRVDLTVYGDKDRYPSDHFAMSATIRLPE